MTCGCWELILMTTVTDASLFLFNFLFRVFSFLMSLTTSQHTSLRNYKLKSRICNSVYRFLAVSSLETATQIFKYFQLASVSQRLSFSYIANWKASLGGLMNSFTWFFSFFSYRGEGRKQPPLCAQILLFSTSCVKYHVKEMEVI